MDLDRHKAVVREFEALGNEGGDLSRLDQLCAPDVINHALAPGRPPGIEGTLEFLRSAQRDVYPSRWVTSNLLAETDLVVQFGPREHNWPGGSFRGFELIPGRYTRDVMFAYRLADGRIAERWAIRDDLAMVLALGGLTSPH